VCRQAVDGIGKRVGSRFIPARRAQALCQLALAVSSHCPKRPQPQLPRRQKRRITCY
jgi:hypothetical protein